jgi:hypothetical protein
MEEQKMRARMGGHSCMVPYKTTIYLICFPKRKLVKLSVILLGAECIQLFKAGIYSTWGWASDIPALYASIPKPEGTREIRASGITWHRAVNT